MQLKPAILTTLFSQNRQSSLILFSSCLESFERTLQTSDFTMSSNSCRLAHHRQRESAPAQRATTHGHSKEEPSLKDLWSAATKRSSRTRQPHGPSLVARSSSSSSMERLQLRPNQQRQTRSVVDIIDNALEVLDEQR
ncbi:expressed unknown protein [Seminavis robusta]|uniref:Uncharacterized protein n=1 Tax=Seminavis robusta TaxID=568900 RepID=A0A9N8E8K9_9STRA|nr:expressed unknown protein [Seminavis robusta]|eukprot:Sro802_g204681.1  (138) ;mRNA; f:31074-31487